MRPGVAGLAVLGLAGCASYWPTFRAPVRAGSSAADVFACARAEVRAAGFSPTVWNEGDRVLEARRRDPVASARLQAEQRQIDVVTVRVREGAGGGVPVLSVRAATVTTRFTRAGLIEEDAPASALAQQVARTVVARCTGRGGA